MRTYSIKIMINFFLRKTPVLLFPFLLVPIVQASTSPLHESDIGRFGNFRIFQKAKKWNFLVEYSKHLETDSLTPEGIKIGAKYRLSKSIKLGAYYRRASGQRYDDDWVLLDGKWQWLNTDDRQENHYQAELIYRKKTSSKMVFELKNVYQFNAFNDQQIYLVKPGLTYFKIKNGKARYHLYGQYEAQFPLNFSEATIWQHWFYLGGLYHISQKFSLGPFAGYRIWTWTTSSQIRQRQQPEYEVSLSGFFAGFNIVLRNLF